MSKSAVLGSVLNTGDRINTLPKHRPVEVPGSILTESDYPECNLYETQKIQEPNHKRNKCFMSR